MMSENKVTKKQIEDAFEEAVREDNLCNLGKLLNALDSDVRKVVEAKVADDLHYSGATISRVLKSLGYPPVSVETINKHRKSACRCK